MYPPCCVTLGGSTAVQFPRCGSQWTEDVIEILLRSRTMSQYSGSNQFQSRNTVTVLCSRAINAVRLSAMAVNSHCGSYCESSTAFTSKYVTHWHVSGSGGKCCRKSVPQPWGVPLMAGRCYHVRMVIQERNGFPKRQLRRHDLFQDCGQAQRQSLQSISPQRICHCRSLP